MSEAKNFSPIKKAIISTVIGGLLTGAGGCTTPQDEIAFQEANNKMFAENTRKGQERDLQIAREKGVEKQLETINTGNLDFDDIIVASHKDNVLKEIPNTKENVESFKPVIAGMELAPNAVGYFDGNPCDLDLTGKFTILMDIDGKLCEVSDVLNYNQMPSPQWSKVRLLKGDTSNNPLWDMYIRNDGEHNATIKKFESEEKILNEIKQKDSDGVYSVLDLNTNIVTSPEGFKTYISKNIYSMYISNGQAVGMDSMQEVDKPAEIIKFNNALKAK